MWRRTVFWYLLIIYGHTSSQPIEDSENARQTRQLDFGGCCPCPDADETRQDDFPQPGDTVRAAGVGAGPNPRDLDDCPCRPRSADSDGAASVFFPTALRSRGSVVRLDERKEDFKPLLHPEVDLASSVLQTIREATDEEYEDAIARDAARSMAKAAIEDIYGDAAPEASTRNLVTIIVKPKQADSDDDIITQESRNHESRCIHAPLESARTLSKMRVAQKPPNLLHDIFGLPRRSRPGLLHRNLLDMDSTVGASNVEERVLRVDSDHVPLMEPNSKIGTISSNIKSESDCDHKETNLKLPSIHNKVRDLITGRSSLDGKIKTFLPLPKVKPISSKLNVNGNNNHDLSSSPSNVEEQVGKLSYVKANSHLENILPKTRPFDLKNLLKLKDVELIPLKDLINNAKNPPKLALPSRITNEDEGAPNLTDKSEVNDLLNLVPRVRETEVSDTQVSPSNLIQQVSDDNCENIARSTNSEPNAVESDEKVTSSEFFNTTPSPQLIESDVSDRSTEVDTSQSSELTNNNSDCDLGSIPTTVTDVPLSTERFLSSEIQEIKRGDSDTGTFEKLRADDLVDRQDKSSDISKDDCLNNNSGADSMSGASNAINTIFEPDSDQHDLFSESIARQSQDGNNDIKSFDNNAEPKLLDPLSLDKTLNTIKQNIIEKIESLKIPKTNSGKSNLFGKEAIRNESQNTDSNNEETAQITSVKPEMGTKESSENVDGSQISMQDLQEMSDSMLQHENKEKTRSNMECNVPTQEIAETKEATEMKSTDPQDLSEEQMPRTLQNDNDMNPQSSVNSDNVKDICGSDLPQQSKSQDDDTKVGASETVISKIPPKNAVQSIPSTDLERPCDEDILKSPLHDLSDVLKIAPMPTLDDIKSRVTSLFDKGERRSEDILPIKADSLLDPAKILDPIMATDGSTRNSQSKRPPERFLEDLDFLQLQPLSIFPKSKLTDDLGLKPIKLQSVFDDKGLGLGTGQSRSKNVNRKTGLGYPLDTTKLGDFKGRSSSSPHNILKSSLKHDDLISGRALSDLSRNINTHFKSASRNMHNMLESTFNGAKKATPIQLEPHELLETISRNHEDVNDKLKALHMDFNDRIDTMRNDLLDNSRILTSESRIRKPSIKTLGDHKSLLRTTQPTLTTRTRNTPSRGLDLPKLNGKGSSASSRTNKFKMPTAASVPVPKTVKVPELKMMSKPSGLVPQRTLSSNTHNIELPRTNFDKLRNQGSYTKPINITPLKKPFQPFRNTKVEVSFSTTPRPGVRTGKPKNQEKTGLRVAPENHGIKTDLRQPKLSTPTGLLNKHKLLYTDTDSDKRLSTPLRKPVSKLGNLEPDRNLGSLQSWPKVSEGAFLSKVKEAVKARLPPSNLSNTLKQANIQPNVKSTLSRNKDDVTNGIDMSRAASEVVERTDGQVLKENVTYKCKMVCSQE